MLEAMGEETKDVTLLEKKIIRQIEVIKIFY